MPILDDDDDLDDDLYDDRIFLPCKNCGKLFDTEMPYGHLNNFCYRYCEQCGERTEREGILSHVCARPMTDEERKRAERDRRNRAFEQDILTPERNQPSTGYSKRIQQGGNVERNRRKH